MKETKSDEEVRAELEELASSEELHLDAGEVVLGESRSDETKQMRFG
jgi:rubrerythrin